MHRAESIMQSITGSLAGLATTGANVQRGYGVQLPGLPGLTLRMGSDVPLRQYATDQIDRVIEVFVEVSVLQGAASDTQLNQIRAEVYAALMAAPQLGQAFVIDTRLVGDGEPDVKDLDRPVVKQELTYAVEYRHSYQSAEA